MVYACAIIDRHGTQTDRITGNVRIANYAIDDRHYRNVRTGNIPASSVRIPGSIAYWRASTEEERTIVDRDIQLVSTSRIVQGYRVGAPS